MVNFVIRLVAYAVVLGVTSRVAQTLWSQHGLDGVADLQPLHDEGITTLLVAPIVFALVGFGRLAPLCVFLACLLVGAAITAPFVFARLVGT